MKELIKKELMFIEENADLLRNNYDPVIFDFEGYESKYLCIMEFSPFSIQINVRIEPEICFLLSEKGKSRVVIGRQSREMDEEEEKIFKSFIGKVYDRSKEQHDSWY